MAFEGMDATVIRDVASKLDTHAKTLGEVITALQGTVSRAQQSWQGADQSHFTSAWSARHQPALASAHATLSDLATLLRAQGAAQDTTSNDLVGTPGSAVPGPRLPAAPPVPDPLTNPEVISALAPLQSGQLPTPGQLNALTKALDDLPPDQRQLLVDDLVARGLLPRLNAAVGIDSLGIFNGQLTTTDRLALYSALLASASPASVAAISSAMHTDPSLSGVGTWNTDKDGNPVYTPAPGTLLGANGPHPDDISQGQIGDCYFLSSLIATQQADPTFVQNHLHDNGNGTTTVTLYDHGNPVQVTVTNSVPTDNGNNLGVTSDGDNNWPQIYEKAYAQYRGGYGTIDQGGWGRDGLGAITGQPVTTISEKTGWTNHIPLIGTSPEAPSVDINTVKGLLDNHHAVLVGTNGNSGNTDDQIGTDMAHGLIEHHEYVVQSVNSDGTVTLRNPWDPQDRPRMPWSEIEKQASEVAYTTTAP